MRITKKNYNTIFLALCKHFGIIGFCLKTNALYNHKLLIGIIDQQNEKLFYDNKYVDVDVWSKYLNDAIDNCPIQFKNNAIFSFRDIAYYCRIDKNELLFKFTQEAMKNLCGKDVVFNGKTYKKTSIEELLIQYDLD